MMKIMKTACPLDCWDNCAIDVIIDDYHITVTGDKNHPITRGFLCKKGLSHLERVNSSDRILNPMKKINGKWASIDWEQAIAEIGDHLLEIKKNFGSTTVMHYSESGHCGLLKNIDTAFFNGFGGVTRPIGNLCWGAGIAAQTLDFGKVLSHCPEDHLNAKTIIIWGRNPANTNLHLLPFIKEAKSKGSNIVVIDPIQTETASIATHYYQIKPEADGFLALAMSKMILEKQYHDLSFITQYCLNFDVFESFVRSLELKYLIEKTELSTGDVYELTELYASQKPSAIILGYGLQRYTHGGRNIRFIDALGALTGNIGIPGGGVSYANQYLSQWIDWNYLENSLPYSTPTFKRPLFSQYILEEKKGEIKGIFVTKANPIVQLPATGKTIQAFQSIPFKVVIDLFMTDTAQLADYILPCTHIFEEEDFLYSSMWHSYFCYTERVLPPKGKVKNEFEIFRLLAEYMKMHDYLENYGNEKKYLEKALLPLTKNLGCSLEKIKGKRLKLKGNTVPWENKVFCTPSSKFEFVIPYPNILSNEQNKNDAFPLQLITLHPKHSLHSQHYSKMEKNALPTVYCNVMTLKQYGVHTGEKILIRSPEGVIKGILQQDERIGNNLLMAYEGWWLKNQGINHLTPIGVSDIGNQAIYNNCVCRIEKLE